MIMEMHCHTCEYSACSLVKAVTLVQRVLEKGLQGIAITDHHHFWPAEKLVELRAAVDVPGTFLILSGQEVGTPEFGDVLVYGADRVYPSGTSIDVIRREFPEAALVLAHAYRNGRLPDEATLLDPRLDGIEIFNSNHTVSENTRGLKDWHRYKFTAIAGSDTHAENYAGLYPTVFDHPIWTVEEMAAEIRAGNCHPYFREIHRASSSDTQIVELTLGRKEKQAPDRKIIVKTHQDTKTWAQAERAYYIMRELGTCCFTGGKYRIPLPVDEDPQTLTIIEQRVKGKVLKEFLATAEKSDARQAIQLTAGWVARLHNARVQVTPPEEFLELEPERLDECLDFLRRAKHRHIDRIVEIRDAVMDTERSLYGEKTEVLVQGHGDLHPGNVLIGQDDPADPESRFAAVIDFTSSRAMPPAFDVGAFIEQFQYQFFQKPEITAKVSADDFLTAYLAEAEDLPDDFLSQVQLFKVRTTLRIMAYL
ncbi:MAG: phosphotransferase, partial [Candidatus Hydrogenedentes bacterium]|nr:phosphotransferase [Candidatus Hydrogenedentota bacterium]